MPDNEPHVKVTLSTIYDIQQEHGKVLVEIKDTLKDLVDESADHEVRIRTLERKVWTAAGWAAALSALGGAGVLAAVQKLIA